MKAQVLRAAPAALLHGAEMAPTRFPIAEGRDGEAERRTVADPCEGKPPRSAPRARQDGDASASHPSVALGVTPSAPAERGVP